MMKRNIGSMRVSGQRGYALLMVIFLVATFMIVAVGTSLSIRTEGQREKEEELAWRGNQYVRAVQLYYKKNGGRFPKTLEDLTAYHSDQPRYIRQAYKDPMTADGEWQVIYVQPNGQLTGTILHKQLAGAMPIGGPLGGAPAGGTTPLGPTTGIGQPPSPTTGTSSSSDSQSNSSPVFGGSVIGVASKSKAHSIRIYKDGKSYNEWEFYWDPTTVTGTPAGIPGATPVGTKPPATPGQTTNPGQPTGPGQEPIHQNDRLILD